MLWLTCVLMEVGGAGRVNVVGSWITVARVDSRSGFPMLLFWWWIQRIWIAFGSICGSSICREVVGVVYRIVLGRKYAIICVSGYGEEWIFVCWDQLVSGLMRMVFVWGFSLAANLAQWMACGRWEGGGWAKPGPCHLWEKAGPNEPKMQSLWNCE
jgi:hypothetical protein